MTIFVTFVLKISMDTDVIFLAIVHSADIRSAFISIEHFCVYVPHVFSTIKTREHNLRCLKLVLSVS